MASPTDPICGVSAVDWGYNDHAGDAWSFGGHRAAFQRFIADEVGCEFRDVHVHRVYVRFFTRQEVWDSIGRDAYFEEQMQKLGISFYFGEGYYYDYTGGVKVPAHVLKEMEGPQRVPDDWAPDSLEDVAVFEYCHKDHSDALPAWHAEA